MTAVSTSGCKILIVDDEKLLQSLILQRFKKDIDAKKFEFSFAGNGAEALEILNEQPDIGIVLLDLNMPVMNGFTLLENLMQQKRLYRVIVVTAYGDMVNIRRAMGGGASDFINKPIDLTDLEHTIERNIERFHSLKTAALAHDELLEMSKEIEVAKNIQTSLIPSQFQDFGKDSPLEIYGEVVPTKDMGGNFFDFFKLNETEVGFFVGEVAERGIPAALFMTITRTLLHTIALKEPSPARCFDKINQLLLVKEIAFAIFVTAFYGIIDLKTGKVRYCNAGHRPLFVLSKNNKMREIGRYEGIPLAITNDPNSLQVKFQDKTFDLEIGDTMLLYTNGVLETQNISREMYSESRFKDFVSAASVLEPEPLVKNIQKNLNEFSGGISQMSDMTLFALRYNGWK